MNESVLVVDDEPRMVELLRLTLESAGFRVLEAANGYEAVAKVRDSLPDLVLLDVAMPEMDGYEALAEIRKASHVPVIMLTVRASEADKVRGLELGADDYVAKPFGHRELVSRVRAVLRRSQASVCSPRGPVRVDQDLVVDFDKRQAILRGRAVHLRPTEYRLLYHLVSNPGHLLTHEELLTKVWGREYRDDTQLLRLYVTYLRQKIEPDPAHPRYIFNERGLGYRFLGFASP